MDSVVLTFTVPEQCRELFGHELDLIQYMTEPIVAWLERHGGGMRMGTSVSPTDTL